MWQLCRRLGPSATFIPQNEQVCSLNDVWNISKEMLSGFSGDEDVKRAVSRLSRLIAEGDGAALSEELADFPVLPEMPTTGTSVFCVG